MLTTPILRRPIKPFDAQTDQRIEFYTEGGSQVLRSRLTIINNKTGKEAYKAVQETFGYYHTIPKGTLTNGVVYTARVQTGGHDDKWSMASEQEMFTCMSPATITIPDSVIDTTDQNRVGNETVLFKANYEQEQGEIVESYQYLLYDSNKDLITAFDEVFHNSEEPITQEIAGLINGELYHVQIKTESTNGLISSTDLIWFIPYYTSPELKATLTAENVTEKGAIKLSSEIVQIVGELYGKDGEIIPFEDVEYIDGEWLDLTRPDYQKVVFDKGFETTNSDYTIKLWFENLQNKTLLMRLEGESGMTEFFRVDDTMVAFKSHHGMTSYAKFVSNDFNYNAGKRFMLQVRQHRGIIDLKIFEGEEVI